MCYLFPIWQPDMGMYVRIALLTLICYSWWEEEQAWGLFAPDPDLESPLVLQVWVLGASYSSQQAGMFLTVLLLSSACSTKWAFVHWVSPYTTVLPIPFPPFSPSGELLQSTVVHSACHFHKQGRSSFCPFTSYSDSLKHTCACAHKTTSKPTQNLSPKFLLTAVSYLTLT